MKRKVLTVPNETLTKKSKEITDFGIELQALINDMMDTMDAEDGAGLAAPQIGELQRVIVVKQLDENLEPYVFINPVIAKRSKQKEIGVEGCLSVPDLIGDVMRNVSVTVKGLGRNGSLKRTKAHGWIARVFQHEIDHLEGIEFIDVAERVYPIKELEVKNQQRINRWRGDYQLKKIANGLKKDNSNCLLVGHVFQMNCGLIQITVKN